MCNGLDDDCDGIVGNLLVNEHDTDGDHYLACSGCSATLAAGLLGCGDCNDLVSTIHPGAAEICNGIDDSCAGAGFMDGKDDCGKAGTGNAGKPTCCGGSGCRATTSDYQFCGSCGNNCTITAPTTTNECYQSNCSCATGGACTGGLTCQGVAPAGMCVAGNGSSCTMANQCSSGNCVDMHCCVSAACGDGICKACTGACGTCVNQPANMPGNGCTGAGQVCDGGGACKKATGQACGGNSECWNNLCVDGYCCNTACNTNQCQACNVAGALGTCSDVTGAPVGGRTACNGSGTCGGTCDGAHTTCQYPGGGTACGSQTCAPGAGGAVVTPVGTCNGAGGCSQPSQPPCIYTQCNGNICASNCTLDNQCINTHYCSTMTGGTCQTRHGNGVTCVPDDCEMSGACNFCKAATPCQASGQCCMASCPGPTCTNVSMSASTFVISTCSGTGSCGGPNLGCNGFVCASGSACKTAPCASDTDCDMLTFCRASDQTCATRVGNGGTCANADCQMSPCRECAAGLNCNGGMCK
jgi:hypothetical protein